MKLLICVAISLLGGFLMELGGVFDLPPRDALASVLGAELVGVAIWETIR